MTRIVLANQGNSALLYERGQGLARTNDKLSKITVRLNWKLGVDLDIHAFYKLAKEPIAKLPVAFKPQAGEEQKRRFLPRSGSAQFSSTRVAWCYPVFQP